jgi:hypothetical protein
MRTAPQLNSTTATSRAGDGICHAPGLQLAITNITPAQGRDTSGTSGPGPGRPVAGTTATIWVSGTSWCSTANGTWRIRPHG